MGWWGARRPAFGCNRDLQTLWTRTREPLSYWQIDLFLHILLLRFCEADDESSLSPRPQGGEQGGSSPCPIVILCVPQIFGNTVGPAQLSEDRVDHGVSHSVKPCLGIRVPRHLVDNPECVRSSVRANKRTRGDGAMQQTYSEIPVTSSIEFRPVGALDCSAALELAIAVLSSSTEDWDGSAASPPRLRCLFVLFLGIFATV
jgi:hypothetical protein